jgi:hypothetical protein
MDKVIRKIKTAWRLPQQEKLWILLMYPLSGVIRACILLLPFRWLSRYLGDHKKNLQFSPPASEQQLLLGRRIGRIAELTSRYTPWESKCLVQAMLAKTLLARYGIPYVLYLGAKLTADGKKSMIAHAWVQVGDRVITGREGHKTYAIVGSFVSASMIAFEPDS